MTVLSSLVCALPSSFVHVTSCFVYTCTVGPPTSCCRYRTTPPLLGLCWVSPLGQRTVMGSLDIDVSGNGKKQQTALERKGSTCNFTGGQSELWLGGSINCFALASYSLYRVTLIFFLWPKAVHSYWLSQKPENSFQVSFLLFCL